MSMSEEYKKAKKEALVRHLLEMEAVFDPVIHILRMHTNALACHCECLGMNAENCSAACADQSPPFNENHYAQSMQKWGLINEKGEPII